MKKILLMFMVFILLGVFVGVQQCSKKETIIIYTSIEDYTMNLLQQRLNERFPSYNIVLEYMSTSTVATKVIEEKDKCEADIVYALEYAYLEKLVANNRVTNLKGEYDLSIYLDDVVLDSIKDYVLPNMRTGSTVIINNQVLKQRGISKPTSYEDLLKPEYKGLLSMPSPKSSGTGYGFLLSLTNEWGEQRALNYFNSFANNVISFTSSGSGPINALVNREAAVGLGMISQASEKITAGNNELEILFFDEGAAFSLYGSAVVKGKEKKQGVMEIMDYLYSSFNDEACAKFYPEPLVKDKVYTVANFPTNIPYSNMEGNNLNKKEYLLAKWNH